MEYIERSEGKSKEEWLEKRRHYVTGTDIAKIMGVAPSSWGGKFSVWLDKTGKGTEVEQNGAMRAGLAFESGILKMYAEDMDCKMEHLDGYDLNVSLKYPHLACSLDGWNHTLNVPVDAKNIRWKNEKWGDAWTDEFPDYYKTQLQVQMMVTGAKEAHLAVMFSGQDFVIYRMDYDEKLADAIVKAVDEFWPYVETGKPPDADSSNATETYIKGIFAKGKEGKEKVADDAFVFLVKAFVEAKEATKEAKEKEAELGNRIRAFMGEATVVPGWCTWKNNKSSQETNWEDVATELLATLSPEAKSEVIARHTVIKPGNRTLRITAKGL